jgi:hypothetical protein
MPVTKGTRPAKAEKKQRSRKQGECKDVAGGGGSGVTKEKKRDAVMEMGRTCVSTVVRMYWTRSRA